MEENDNLSEYEDAETYDLENQGFGADGQFFLDYAQKSKGPVLELGCGTGRVTIPLAMNGIDITGIDLAPSMIQRAIHKAGDLKIVWLIKDIRHFQLNRKYGLIFETGSVFQHLLSRTDQEMYLARVKEHLSKDGFFIFSLIFPHSKLLVSHRSEKEWYRYKNLQGEEVCVSGKELYDPINQVKEETAFRRWTDKKGLKHLTNAPLSLRYTFPQEMEGLLHYNGFHIINLFGDWDSSKLTNKSNNIIYVCGI